MEQTTTRGPAVAALVIAVSALLVASLLVAIGAGGDAKAAPSDKCPYDAVFIGAAGSGQNGTAQSPKPRLGPEVQGAFNQLKSTVEAKGRKIMSEQVDYFPRPVSDIARNPLDFYIGINQGIDAAMRQIDRLYKSTLTTSCQTKIVLAGFSQGAMVMHTVAKRLIADHPVIWKMVAGVLLIADGDKVANDNVEHYPTGSNGRTGIRAATLGAQPKFPGSERYKIMSVCVAGDIVCDAPVWLLNLIARSNGVVRVMALTAFGGVATAGGSIHGRSYVNNYFGASKKLADRVLNETDAPVTTTTTKPPATTTTPTTTTPTTTTTTPPPPPCTVPEDDKPDLFMPPAKFGEYYDQVWRVPVLDGCNMGWRLDRSTDSPVQYLGMQTESIPDAGESDGTSHALRVYGTPTREIALANAAAAGLDEKDVRSGPVTIFAEHSYMKEAGIGTGMTMNFTAPMLCWGVLDDDGSYSCNK